MKALSGKVSWRLFQCAGTSENVACRISSLLVYDQVRSRGGGKGEWFPEKKYKGRGFGKSLSARAGVGMESSIRTFSKMTAENPMLRASHCDQIYCGLLRIWHIKFKP